MQERLLTKNVNVPNYWNARSTVKYDLVLSEWLIILFLSSLLFYYYWRLPAPVCTPGVCLELCRDKEGDRLPETGITEGWESSCGCWRLNQGPLEEQPVLFTAELSLQHHDFLNFTLCAYMELGSCAIAACDHNHWASLSGSLSCNYCYQKDERCQALGGAHR